MCMYWQAQPSVATTFMDSNWAGCARTARSNSGGIIAIGQHVVKTYSWQQRVVDPSSTEAKLYAMVALSAETLSIIAFAKGFGMIRGVEV